ncbi:aldo/keto reductase [Pedobacter panaciterrae]|uniref:Aldo/keto reductase n=1 Tax=Pedobacter panaciterrae TaxID=363849 RepID=A0ABU8NHK0_9SPHI
MPILGIGLHQVWDLKDCEQSVRWALELGYRLIDTASAYKNEEAVGKAVRESKVPREDLFITSKLWVSDAGYEKAKKALELSLSKLQMDYIDLYLIHLPYSDVHGAWRAMEELYKEGKIRSIGLSNFEPFQVMDIMTFNEVAPVVNQIETHPFNQRIQEQKFLKENRIQHMSWAPFAQGKNDLFNNEVLRGIADNHGKTIAQIVLKWLIQRDIVVIPKSVSKERLAENFLVFDFTLPQEDMEMISSLDRKTSSFLDQRDPSIVKQLGQF